MAWPRCHCGARASVREVIQFPLIFTLRYRPGTGLQMTRWNDLSGWPTPYHPSPTCRQHRNPGPTP